MSLSAETASKPRFLLFQPLVVLLFSLAAAALCGMYLLRGSGVNAGALSLSGSFFYVTLIVVPFVAFLFDRAEHLGETKAIRLIVDVLVIGLAIGRVVAIVPLVSGHTLFLSYALLSSRSVVVIVSASLVMLQVIYLKYFVWHDLVTSTSGILLGCLSAYCVNRIQARQKGSE